MRLVFCVFAINQLYVYKKQLTNIWC